VLSRRDILLFAAAPLAAQRVGEHRMAHTAEDYLERLDDPQRDSWQRPHQVVAALELRKDEVLADIGAGSGYFSRRFARHAGKVYAVDIEKKLLDVVAKDAPPNLQTILAAPADPKLPPASVDTIFFCNVLHHISNRPAYYEKLARALKPGGRLAVIDFHKREAPVGPSIEHKISEQDMTREIEASGFRRTKSWDFLPHQYFLEFRRREV
jgi:ubiquinone/menaquinone biosynthesis C-methylase UbiE